MGRNILLARVTEVQVAENQMIRRVERQAQERVVEAAEVVEQAEEGTRRPQKIRWAGPSPTSYHCQVQRDQRRGQLRGAPGTDV